MLTNREPKLRRKFNFFYCPKEIVHKVSEKSDEQMSMFPVNGADCLEICAFCLSK